MIRLSIVLFVVLCAACAPRSCGTLPVEPDGGVPVGGTAGASADAGISGGTGGAGLDAGIVCDAVPSRTVATLRAALLPRIVHGEDVPIGEHPWVCSIQTVGGFHYCGGSLIADDAVLTAAHCQVEFGDHVLCGRTVLSGAGGEDRLVIEVRNNPAWTSTTSGNDVALLHLDSPVAIQPIPVGQATRGAMTTLGWGRIAEGGAAADHMQRGAVEWRDCAPYGSSIDETMLCATGYDAQGQVIDACQGDSGGPLLQLGAVVGITSWGRGCAREGWPGVYTDVGAMRGWIEACAVF